MTRKDEILEVLREAAADMGDLTEAEILHTIREYRRDCKIPAIADLGSGTGRLSGLLACFASRVFAIEINPACIEVMRQSFYEGLPDADYYMGELPGPMIDALKASHGLEEAGTLEVHFRVDGFERDYTLRVLRRPEGRRGDPPALRMRQETGLEKA